MRKRDEEQRVKRENIHGKTNLNILSCIFYKGNVAISMRRSEGTGGESCFKMITMISTSHYTGSQTGTELLVLARSSWGKMLTNYKERRMGRKVY